MCLSNIIFASIYVCIYLYTVVKLPQWRRAAACKHAIYKTTKVYFVKRIRPRGVIQVYIVALVVIPPGILRPFFCSTIVYKIFGWLWKRLKQTWARGGRTDSPAAITILPTYIPAGMAHHYFSPSCRAISHQWWVYIIQVYVRAMYNWEFVYRYIALTKMFICAAWNENYIIFFKFYCYFFIFLLSRLLSYCCHIYNVYSA